MDKKELWEAIKTKDPTLAAILKAAQRVFGKPKSLKARLK